MRLNIKQRLHSFQKDSLTALLSVFMILCFTSTDVLGKSIVATPSAKQISENGKATVTTITILPLEPISGSAPMEMSFTSNVTSSTANLRYEWKISTKEDFNSTLLSRFDQDMNYTFTSAGKYFIKLYITDTQTNEGYESDAFMVAITESELRVPNAFSPNGDGVNDVFKVSYKSLVKFNATIFNRWGQELFRWNNPDEGWDGSSHEKQVKDGVYFIVIEAVGADGVKYNYKKDINILRGGCPINSAGTT